MTNIERIVLVICLCVLALFCIDQAKADDFVDVPVGAHHWSGTGLNEHNYGIGYEHSQGDLTGMVGAYRNSMYRTSVYGLIGYTPAHLGPFAFGGLAGAVTGYHNDVAAGLLLTAQHGRVGVNVVAIPSVSSMKVVGFVAVQVKFKIR